MTKQERQIVPAGPPRCPLRPRSMRSPVLFAVLAASGRGRSWYDRDGACVTVVGSPCCALAQRAASAPSLTPGAAGGTCKERASLHTQANEVRRLNSAVQCTVCAVDVSQYEAQDSAIRAHVQRHGNLDLVVLNAGEYSTLMLIDHSNNSEAHVYVCH